MKRVGEIQKAREARFFNKRMAIAKATEKEAAAIEIAQSIHLVEPARARAATEVNVAETVKVKQSSGKKLVSE